MDADDIYLFSKILCHGITTKPGSVVVSQADPHSWILQNDPIHPLDSWDPSEISNLGDLPDWQPHYPSLASLSHTFLACLVLQWGIASCNKGTSTHLFLVLVDLFIVQAKQPF